MTRRSLKSPDAPALLPLTGPKRPVGRPRKCNHVKDMQTDDPEPQARSRGVLVDDLNVGFHAANLRRCPGCGGMVYLWPCLACGRRRAA